MLKTLVISQSVENAIIFNAGPFNPDQIITEAKKAFYENDSSIDKAIETLNQQLVTLSNDESRTEDYDFNACVRLALKLFDTRRV